MTFNEYQEKASVTKMYPTENRLGVYYTTMGLASEAGEVAGKVKKVLRDKNGVFDGDSIRAIGDEISDVLWYCAMLAHELGLTMDDIAVHNLQKLHSRAERGKITGEGDNR